MTDSPFNLNVDDVNANPVELLRTVIAHRPLLAGYTADDHELDRIRAKAIAQAITDKPGTQGFGVRQELITLALLMERDHKYALLWHGNFVNSIMQTNNSARRNEVGDELLNAHKAAAHFMMMSFGIDTSDHPGFPELTDES